MGVRLNCLLAFVALGSGLVLCTRAAEPTKAPNEIIVSSVNFVETPPAVLSRLFRQRPDLPDAPPPPTGRRPVRYYQFLPSEPLAADLSYLQVCEFLLPVLAAKNLVNTTDKEKVDFILRITFGERRWRDPFVRGDYLTWRDGLVPKRRNTALSAAETWDDRAGGDEQALLWLERDLGLEGMADSMIGNLHTEDYYLIVVDAFEVAVLRKKGNDTPRAWTTFIAVKRQKGVKFSDLAATMVAKAAPYFGETLPGKARFLDRQGSVEIRDLKVIEDKDQAPPKK